MTARRALLGAGLLALGGLYVVAAIDWGMPNPRAPETDSLVIDGGWAYRGEDLLFEGGSLYPPLYFHLMEAAHVPLRRWVGPDEDPARVAPAFVIAARVPSALLALAAAAAVYALGRRAGGPAAGALAAALFLANPTVFYYSRTTNPDLAFLAWFVLSAALAARIEAGERRFLGEENLFWLAAAASIATKDQAAALYPLVASYFAWKLRGPARVRFVAGGVLGVAAYFATYLPYGGWGWDRFVLHVTAWVERSSHFERHDLSLPSQLALVGETAWDLLLAAGPVLLVLGLAGSWRLLAAGRSSQPRFFGLAFLPYAIALFLFARRSNVRYQLPAIPYLAIAAGAVIAPLLAAPGRLRLAGRALAGAVLLHAILGTWVAWRWLDGDPVRRSKARLVAAVEAGEIPAGSAVGVFSIQPGIAFYQKDGEQRTRETYRDWSELQYGPIDPRLPLLPLPRRPDVLYVALPRSLAYYSGGGAPEPAWIADLLAGRLGYRRLAEIRQPAWLDFSHLHPRRDVVLLVADDLARAERLLLAVALRETPGLDAATEAIEFLPSIEGDSEVRRRHANLSAAVAPEGH